MRLEGKRGLTESATEKAVLGFESRDSVDLTGRNKYSPRTPVQLVDIDLCRIMQLSNCTLRSEFQIIIRQLN